MNLDLYMYFLSYSILKKNEVLFGCSSTCNSTHWDTIYDCTKRHRCGCNVHVHNHFALVLYKCVYVVTAFMHYTPYSPGRGVLTIT